jgi:TrmH family RNA methyltransferase
MLTKATIALIKSLDDKKSRTETGLFVAEGAKLVEELIASSLTVREVYALPQAAARLTASVSKATESLSVTEVTSKEMERISRLKTPSELLAVVEIPRRTFDARSLSQNLVLALDDVQDPGNLGTIIRLADWFGIAQIVCSPASADAFNPKVVQATMGAIARVHIYYLPLTEVLTGAQEQKIPVYGTFLEGEPLYSAPLSATGIIVMGHEGRGISPQVEALVTRRLFIPPYPPEATTSESLNVATATAIICSEFRRR